ncbi:zinc finger CCCH domain-containing protein 10-like [Ambystoma mexicanum]|uniref:zinc finger CCCH domain-containing protein 10-like n=1 Tax=Ambystoma mexicanum TaxID=8296 RepID=UPI0037E7319B
MADRDNIASGNEEAASASLEDVCRDFMRNVCKRGKACRYRHPENTEAPAGMSARKNEYLFCHDFQNKECVRINCRFLHGSREDEEYYRKCGELPPHLSQIFGAGMGAPVTDVTNTEVPVCMDFLKGNCKRGTNCKFRHVQREYNEYEYQYDPRNMEHMAMAPAINPAVRRYDGYDMYNGMFQADPYEDHNSLLKRRRVEAGMHYPAFDYSAAPVRSVEHRMLEEEVVTLRRRVEELKKQVSNLAATNEVLLEQNAQFRNQAMVPPADIAEQAIMPTVCPVTNYNHGIAQTHTTLSSHAMQPRLVSQHDLMGSSGAQSGQANAAGQMNPDMSAALAQTMAQGMAPPVSVATVVSMSQPLPPGTTPMASYPIASQSMRIPAMPH